MNWTQNDFWSKRKGNGLYKIEFYTLSTRGNEKTHSIFERKTKESCDFLIDNMKKWGQNRKGNFQKCWRVFNDNFECVSRGVF